MLEAGGQQKRDELLKKFPELEIKTKSKHLSEREQNIARAGDRE